MPARLTIQNDTDAINPDGATPASIEIHVDDKMAARLEAASQAKDRPVVELVIGRREIVEWGGLGPVPILRCFGFGMNLSQLYIEQHQSIHISASMTGAIDKSGVQKFRTTVESGSVQLSATDGFHNHSASNKLFAPLSGNQGDTFLWLRNLWNEPNQQVAGITFGRHGFELELIDTSAVGDEPSRRRVSLISRSPDSELWQLSSCGTGDDHLDPLTVLKRYRERVESLLKTCGLNDTVQIVPRRGRADENPGVFYRRSRRDQAASVETLIRPDFGLLFTDGELRKTWHPETLVDNVGKLVLHQQDEVANPQQSGSGSNLAARLLLTPNDKENAALRRATLPELRCAGIRDAELQDGKLWQFGRVKEKPTCLQEPVAIWTRFDVPDQSVVRPPADTAMLPLPLQDSHLGWQVNLGIDREEAEAKNSPLLKMTLSLETPSVQLELFDGPVTLFTPDLQTYSSRLQDSSSPPNAKLLGESLRPARLVFGQPVAENEPRLNDREPVITLPELKDVNSPTFVLNSTNDAIVSYPPHARDAGIDYLSAGAKNLRQRVDLVTLRTIVDRDTTHLLTPFPIKSCQLDQSSITGLIEVNWQSQEESPKLAAAMALAPWVSMQDSVDANIAEPATRNRSLHHRNLALEHGEFAAASLDRASDGIPRGLAESAEDFVNSTRDEYTVAVDSLPDRKDNAAEIGHWLPGATLDNAPKAWIHYPDASDAELRAPIVHSDDTFNQSLQLQTGTADETQSDWLTCDVRLDEVRNEAGYRPRAVVNVVPVDTNDAKPATSGRLRARNGSVPWLFDGKDFSAVALDSSSRPSGMPLTWCVAAGATGVTVQSRATGVVEAELPGSSADTVRVGTGQTTTSDWTTALQSDGTLKSWHRLTGTDPWERSLNAVSVGFSVTASAVTSNETSVAVLAVDSASDNLRLWVWRPNPNTDAPDVDLVETIDTLESAGVFDVSLLFVGDELFVAAATNDDLSPKAFRGVNNGDGTWTFTEVTIEDGDDDDVDLKITSSASRIALGYFNPQQNLWPQPAEPWKPSTDYVADQPFAVWIPPNNSFLDIDGREVGEGTWNAVYPTDHTSGLEFNGEEAEKVRMVVSVPRVMLATVDATREHWCLAEFAQADTTRFQQIDAVAIPKEIGEDGDPVSIVATDICLATRPDSNHGLPVASRPGWVIVANETGNIDLWLSTPEASTRSVDAALAARFASGARQPLIRLNGHPGTVTDLDASDVNVQGTQDPRTGLLSCGNDGTIRLWNVDAAAMLLQIRADEVWMDNLGSLRDPSISNHAGSSWTQHVNRPRQVSLPRSAASEYVPQDNSDSLSIGHAPGKAGSWLVRSGHGTPRLTEVYFSCESLRLLCKVGAAKTWVPEPVQGESGKFFAASRGYSGVFGFYSTVTEESVRAVDFLPRIGGVPIFFRDINAITFESGNVDPSKIMSMTLTAVLINPLLLDGCGSTVGDIRRGDAPAFLTSSIHDQSLVTVEIKRKTLSDPLLVTDVRSVTNQITWNLLISDELTATGSDGFEGRMEQLSFSVSFDQQTQRILLKADSTKSEARLLEGSQPLNATANAQLILESFGRDANDQPCYGFEALRADKSDDTAALPLLVDHPYQRFNDLPPIAHLATDDIGGSGDFITSHEVEVVDAENAHEIRWWDTLTGLTRNQFGLDQTVTSLAYGRSLTAFCLCPDAFAPFGPTPFDPLSIGRLEIFKANAALTEPLRVPDSSAEVSCVCVITDTSRSVVAAGDESGRVHFIDAVTGELQGVLELAADMVEVLAGTVHHGRPVAVAFCGGRLSLIDVTDGQIVDETSFAEDAADVFSKRISLLLVDDDLWIFAASHSQVLGWKWSGHFGNAPSTVIKPPTDQTTQSMIAGHDGDTAGLFYAASDGKLRHANLNGVPKEIATGLPPATAIDFIASDDNTHFLAVATPEKPLLILSQERIDGIWNKWSPTTNTDKINLPADIGQIRFVNADDIVLAVASPADGHITTQDDTPLVVLAASDGNPVMSFGVPTPAGSRWYSATGLAWMPHCVTCNGTDQKIDLHNLDSGSRSRQLTVPGDEPVLQLAFADTGAATWLVANTATATHSLRISGTLETQTLADTGSMDLKISGPFAVVGGPAARVTFWEIGTGESDNTRRLQLTAHGDVQFVAVTQPNASAQEDGLPKKTAVVAAECFGEAVTWKLSFDTSWSASDRHDFETPTVSSFDYVHILSRDHLCLGVVDGDRRLISLDILLPDDAPGKSAVGRWKLKATSVGEPQISVSRLPEFTVFVGDDTALSAWCPNQILAFDERGRVTAQLDVDLNLDTDDVGFGVAGQVLQTGRVRLLEHNVDFSQVRPLLSGLSRQGMFCFIGDCLKADTVAGTTTLVLRREAAKFAGTSLQSKFVRRELSAMVKALEGPDFEFRGLAEFTQQVTRTFGTESRLETLISGRLKATQTDELPFEIHFADQVVRSVDEPESMVGMLIFEHGGRRLQGPALCGMRIVDGNQTLEIAAGVFRVIPSRFETDTLASDYAFPTHSTLAHLDLAVPILDAEGVPEFVQFSGTETGIQLHTIGQDRIPLNLCMDSAVRPFPTMDSTIPQLAHRRGLGRRIRFDQKAGNLFRDESSGNWDAVEDQEVVWQMRPLLNGDRGLRLMAAGVVMEAGSDNQAVTTENVLAIVRPATPEDSSVVCLITETGAPDGSEPHVRADSLVDAVNRRILLKLTFLDESLPTYSVVAGQSIASVGFRVPQQLRPGTTAPDSDSRLLMHAAARRVLLDGRLEREVLPATSDNDQDNDRFAVREMQVRLASDHRRIDRTNDVRHRAVWLQEATAFKDMTRLWHQPDGLQPWVQSSGEENAETIPFHPSSLKLRLAADKPGAMMHHRLQLALEAPPQTESSPPEVLMGPQLSFAMREPMQLNPPIGSSVEITSAELKEVENAPWHTLSFRWKETLGTIPVRASADVLGPAMFEIKDNLPADAIEIKLKSEAFDCMQLIVQLNDQLIDMDRRQPLFPVYDARRAALTKLSIDEAHDKLLPNALPLGTEIQDIDVFSLIGQELFAASGEGRTRVWNSHDGPVHTISWNEQVRLRLGWWAGQAVALTDRGGKLRLFDPFEADSELKELRAASATVVAQDVDITRMISAQDGQQYDVAVALAENQLHVWSSLSEEDDINVTPKDTSVDHPKLTRLHLAVAADQKSALLVLWSPGEADVQLFRLSINESGAPVLSDRSTVSDLTPETLTVTLEGLVAATPAFYVGRENGSLAVFDETGTLLREITLAEVPIHLDAILDGGRPLLAVTRIDNEGHQSVVVLDGRTLRTLRTFAPPAQGTVVPRRTGRLVRFGEPVLACTDGADKKNLQLFRVALSTARPGNMFLLTKADPTNSAKRLFEPEVEVEVQGVSEKETVRLKAKLVLLNSQGNEVSSVEMKQCFTEPVTSADGTTLYRFNREAAKLKFSGAVAVRIEWTGSSEDETVKLRAKFDRDRGFRLLPYSATAAKMSGVLTVDRPNADGVLSQIMQRNLIFGDSASPSDGNGVLRKVDFDGVPTELFALETKDEEQVDVPMPMEFDGDTWRLILSCVKYHIDGQATSSAKTVTT